MQVSKLKNYSLYQQKRRNEMKYRTKAPRRKDKKIFRKTAQNSNVKNQIGNMPRGGKCL